MVERQKRKGGRREERTREGRDASTRQPCSPLSVSLLVSCTYLSTKMVTTTATQATSRTANTAPYSSRTSSLLEDELSDDVGVASVELGVVSGCVGTVID